MNGEKMIRDIHSETDMDEEFLEKRDWSCLNLRRDGAVPAG